MLVRVRPADGAGEPIALQPNELGSGLLRVRALAQLVSRLTVPWGE